MIDERMLDYYPEVIKAIYEIQAIVQAEYPEFELQADSLWNLINEAYFTTMGEERVKQWEQLLNIQPLSDSTIEDRRETIIARIRGSGKLNTQLIYKIVHIFTQGDVESYFSNSTIYVKIFPPAGNKEYKYINLKKELQKHIPAHLGLDVKRAFCIWHNIKIEFNDWNDVLNNFATWEDVMLFVTQNKIKWKEIKIIFKNWNVVKEDFESWIDLYLHQT